MSYLSLFSPRELMAIRHLIHHSMPFGWTWYGWISGYITEERLREFPLIFKFSRNDNGELTVQLNQSALAQILDELFQRAHVNAQLYVVSGTELSEAEFKELCYLFEPEGIRTWKAENSFSEDTISENRLSEFLAKGIMEKMIFDNGDCGIRLSENFQNELKEYLRHSYLVYPIEEILSRK